MKSVVIATTVLISAAPAARAEVAPDDQRDEVTASTLSVAGTLGELGVVIAAGEHTRSEWRVSTLELAAAAALPSLGHVYGGEWLSAGLGMRVAGAAAVVLGFYEFDRGSNAWALGGPYDGRNELGMGLVLTGLGTMIVGTAYDIATAPRAVRRYNREHRTVMPVVAPTPVGATFGFAGMF